MRTQAISTSLVISGLLSHVQITRFRLGRTKYFSSVANMYDSGYCETEVINGATIYLPCRSKTLPWSVDLAAQSSMRFFETCHGQFIEDDLRNTLKAQTTIRRHQEWIAQRRTKRAIPDLHAVDWTSALSYLHSKRQVFSLHSNGPTSRHRSLRVQALHGAQPTMTVMKERHPHMYPDALCRQCGVEVEDNDHIWNCPRTSVVQQDIWDKAISLLDTWGPLEVTQANNTASRRRALAAEKGKHLPPPTPPFKWCPIPAIKDWDSLSFIVGAEARRDGDIFTNPDTFQEPVGRTWTVGAIYRGLTPLELSQGWKDLFAVLLSVTRRLAHRFVSYLAAQATELIWRPRCTVTVAWEKQRGITKA
ncbi:hypothetical protein BGZ94_002984, partial [Podila epigama]